MKAPDRKTVSQLEELPNIGKAIGKDLRLIGVDHPQELIGKNAFQLYHLLCNQKGSRIDHCVIDVFMSAIDYMEGGESQPWWTFTEKRKKSLIEKEKGIMK
jgi:hypothetical protein